MKQYFYIDANNQQVGPINEDALMELVRCGDLSRQTPIWTEGLANWMPVEYVWGGAVKQAEPPSAPPPPPPPPPSGYTNTPYMPPPAAPSSGWNVINAFTCNMKRYAHFEGRSCKSEYWYFVLAQFILGALSLCFGEDGFLVVNILISLAFFVPNMAISYRRLQDAGYNGTAAAVIDGILGFLGLFTILATEFLVLDLLAIIFIIVLGCMPSKNVNNPYGTAPLPPI